MLNLADKVSLIYGDVRDTDLVKTALERFEIENIFHLAAQPIVPVCYTHPYESLSVNVMGTYSMLEALRSSSFARSLVFASSGAILRHDDGTGTD